VHDSLQVGGAEPVAHSEGLRPAQRAELETIQVAVQQPSRIFDVGVPDQEDSS
jgi:hypothetical protein